MFLYNVVNTIGVRALEFDFTKPFSDAGSALSYGLRFSLFGLAVVFGVLALLWGILEIFRIVFSGTGKAKDGNTAGGTEKGGK